MAAAGHHLELLPPYTPWFNPTESVFSCIKPAVGWQDLADHGSLELAIQKQVDRIDGSMCQGWIRECKRWAQVARMEKPLSPDYDASTALAQYGLQTSPASNLAGVRVEPDLQEEHSQDAELETKTEDEEAEVSQDMY